MTTTVDTQIREDVLAAGANAVLQQELIDATAAPSFDGPGYDVQAFGRADVSVIVGRDAPRRRWVLTCPTFDAASTYTIDLGSSTYTGTIATPATEAAMWADLLSDLLTATAGTDITVTADASSSGSLTITAPPDVNPLTWTATGGSPTLAMSSEATGCRARVYGRLPSSAGASFVPDTDDDHYVVRGWKLLTTADGGVHDYDVGPDGIDITATWVRPLQAVRVWVSDITSDASDSCSPGAITVIDPQAMVAPATLGVSP